LHCTTKTQNNKHIKNKSQKAQNNKQIRKATLDHGLDCTWLKQTTAQNMACTAHGKKQLKNTKTINQNKKAAT